jgi:SAM-dependent methyltransferase
MPLQPHEIQDFYEECYTPGVDGEKYRQWRELGALGKADHVVELARAIGLAAPGSVVEVGCGDGAVLAELGRRGFGARHVALEISESAVELARRRPEIAEAQVFDGTHVPAGDGAYDLAFATHVLEHVPSPGPLLREMMRAARAVIVEVPLEDNLSARRPAARAASEGAGHLQRFDRGQVRRLIVDAGWQVRAELLDPLPREVHLFGRETAAARAKGWAKWAVRAALAGVPSLGTRLITMHYAVAATPAPASRDD